MMKKFLLFPVLFLCLISCKKASIIGTWGTINESDGITLMQTRTFSDNGECFTTMLVSDSTASTKVDVYGIYQISGDTITTTFTKMNGLNMPKPLTTKFVVKTLTAKELVLFEPSSKDEEKYTKYK